MRRRRSSATLISTTGPSAALGNSSLNWLEGEHKGFRTPFSPSDVLQDNCSERGAAAWPYGGVHRDFRLRYQVALTDVRCRSGCRHGKQGTRTGLSSSRVRCANSSARGAGLYGQDR